MKYILLFIACYFTNILEVYHIQGSLTNMRMQKWWEESLNKKYLCKNIKVDQPEVWKMDKNSWIPCLIAHAFEWTFCSILPLAIYGYANYHFENTFFWWIFIAVFFGNVILHYVIDIFRTHVTKITWFQDQLLHLVQIIIMIAILGSI